MNKNKSNFITAGNSKQKTTIESITINIVYSYTDINYTGIINCKIYNKEYIIAKELFQKLNEFISVTDFQISIYNTKNNIYMLIGVYPDKILQEKIYLNQNIINKKNNDCIVLKFKFRQIINKDNKLRTEFPIIENENEEAKMLKEFPELGEKSRRSKERKIGSVVKKVYMWRKMYTGFQDDKGNFYKFTLEGAAEKIGISKKSLDDYLIQLRAGRSLGFNFNEHQNDRIGVLRSFIKKAKCSNNNE